MTPIFQTDFGNGTGNCLQACIASLFDLQLENVPHFIIQDDWKKSLGDFYLSKGYKCDPVNSWCNPNYDFLTTKQLDKINPKIEIDFIQTQGVNGYYCASVFSPKYFDLENLTGFHAVIINDKGEIVHDPVMDYQYVEYPLTKILGLNGILTWDMIEKL